MDSTRIRPNYAEINDFFSINELMDFTRGNTWFHTKPRDLDTLLDPVDQLFKDTVCNTNLHNEKLNENMMDIRQG
jgi:hypothetical protein